MPITNLTDPVLIIEDDRNTAVLISTYLEREGFTTRMVQDGSEALELARRQRYGFVILDIIRSLWTLLPAGKRRTR